MSGEIDTTAENIEDLTAKINGQQRARVVDLGVACSSLLLSSAGLGMEGELGGLLTRLQTVDSRFFAAAFGLAL